MLPTRKIAPLLGFGLGLGDNSVRYKIVNYQPFEQKLDLGTLINNNNSIKSRGNEYHNCV